jgi:hypothetical protein
MDYRVISADDHIDMQWLPTIEENFTGVAPEARRPHPLRQREDAVRAVSVATKGAAR